MMRSMFSGVSGLRNHQLRMDVIGNNIANVNTVGYKKGRVTFQDMLSQSLRGASGPQGGKGGSNPQQIGLGMNVNSIDVLHTQGSSETTGKITDMMVDGDGFFVLSNGSNSMYSRAGNFDFDSLGNLVNPSGLMVQGWTADNAGVIDTTSTVGGIIIPKGQSIQPMPTANATFVNNLDASTADGGVVNSSMQIYDSLGNTYTIPITFTKVTSQNQWTIGFGAYPPGITNAAVSAGASQIDFNPDGSYLAPVPFDTVIDITLDPAFSLATTPVQVLSDFTDMTQYSGPSNVIMNSQDGYSSGVLNGYAIDKSGIITGRFSNGLTKTLAQVALSNFNNPGGLIKMGENLYIESNNSGTSQVGVAGAGGRGDISPGKLEMSNVDLAQEFTDMIITQRGFQANSRIITVSDEMLQELVNLKR
jgi:flagellar hook protein FlgE